MQYSNDTYEVNSRSSSQVAEFVNKVYSMMALGLGLTGLIAMFTLNIEPLLVFAIKSRFMLFFAEIGVVLFLSFRINKMPAQTAFAWFLLYAALNGITLAPICLIYTKASVAQAFFIAAGMFGGMAIWGTTTKKDLSSIGSICVMGLFGLIIAHISNFFIQSTQMDRIISYAGVAIFTGLTAWDAQKIKRLGSSGMATGGMAVLGALTLYLDFINLFLYILRIMGKRK